MVRSSLPTPATSGGNPVSDLSLNVHAVNIVIPEFASSFVLSELATLFDTNLPTFDFSGVATLDIPTYYFNQCFQFSIDDVVQLSDPNGNLTDTRFYVVDSSINALRSEPGINAIVTPETAIATTDHKTGQSLDPTTQMIISQDYLRYLAKGIFGTANGVDLFYNETDLITDIKTKITNTWDSSCNAILHAISTAGTDSHLQQDPSASSPYDGWSYLDNSDPTGQGYINIGQTIFDQLLTTQPGRFDTSGGLIQDTGAPQPIPLMEGDSISYQLTIHPHAGQTNLMNGQSIPEYKYKIQMNLGPSYPFVTGASRVVDVNGRRFFYITESTNVSFKSPRGYNVELFVLGGGGAGSYPNGGGGGGAGGLAIYAGHMSNGVYTITIGDGGNKGGSGDGNGGNTIITNGSSDTLEVYGGGAGGSYSTSLPSSGGCAGGASVIDGFTPPNTSSAIVISPTINGVFKTRNTMFYGYGATLSGDYSNCVGGGGIDGPSINDQGGPGIEYLDGMQYGGGGGGSGNIIAANNATHGGGIGHSEAQTQGEPAQPNTGGGGGGGNGIGLPYTNVGGSGIVIISYVLDA